MKTTPYRDQPAFPCDTPIEFHDTGEVRRRASGLTVRDWLAGQALAGLLAAYAFGAVKLPKAAEAARDCYDYADAILAAREEKR